MAVEGREQVTCIGIVRVNGQPEELDGLDGRRQPSMGGTSRVRREAQARFCERLGVKYPGPTRLAVVCSGPMRKPCGRYRSGRRKALKPGHCGTVAHVAPTQSGSVRMPNLQRGQPGAAAGA